MLQRTTSPPFLAGHAVRPGVGVRHESAGVRAAGEVVVPGVRLLRGREAILAAQPMLAELAARTAQAGEADSLAYFLSTPEANKKIPCALLLDGEGRAGSPELAGAILLFEYKAGLAGARVFASGDGSGRRDVLAAPELRARMAAFAARTLIEQGAHLVQIAFCETHNSYGEVRTKLDPEAVPDVPHEGVAEQVIAAELRGAGRKISAQWTLREMEVPAYLPLFATEQATLARIGQRTRSNLRYYRRRAELDLGARFEASAQITREEFLAFNRVCTYSVPDAMAGFRYDAVKRLAPGCLRGVRDGAGRWLSLVGTRRHDGFVEIDWQMNRADLPQYSLGTVMRAYLIEHEIGLGSTRLYIEGGTPQPIGRSFVKQRLGELTVKRDSAYVRLLERFASVVFPPKNYVGQTLIHPDLHWKRW